MTLNSLRYWDERFVTGEWRAAGGPAQSQRYMQLLLLHQPVDLSDLTVCDFGCAEGDGTALIKQAFPTARVSGCDIAPGAIETASARYPGIEFAVAPDGHVPAAYDVIITSNTLEHLQDAQACMQRLLKQCSLLLIMVPFDQLHEDGAPLSPARPMGEHVQTFTWDSLAGFPLLDRRVILIDRANRELDGIQQILFVVRGGREFGD